MLVFALMENELRKQMIKLRHTAAFVSHRLRHAWDEFCERFASWRPTQLSSPVSPETPQKSLRTVWSDYREGHPNLLQQGLCSLLFLVSIGVGFSLKSWAEDHILIGHEDYRLIPAEQLYALNVLREKALQNGAPLTVESKPVYPACEEDADIAIDEGAL